MALGPIVVRKTLAISRSEAWQLLTGDDARSAWWPNTQIDAQIAGQVIDGESREGTVDVIVPNQTLGFSWLNSESDVTTSAVILLRPDDENMNDTVITVIESGFAGHENADELVAASEARWIGLFDALATVTGSEDGVDTSDEADEADEAVAAEADDEVDLEAEADLEADADFEADAGIDDFEDDAVDVEDIGDVEEIDDIDDIDDVEDVDDVGDIVDTEAADLAEAEETTEALPLEDSIELLDEVDVAEEQDYDQNLESEEVSLAVEDALLEEDSPSEEEPVSDEATEEEILEAELIVDLDEDEDELLAETNDENSDEITQAANGTFVSGSASNEIPDAAGTDPVTTYPADSGAQVANEDLEPIVLPRASTDLIIEDDAEAIYLPEVYDDLGENDLTGEVPITIVDTGGHVIDDSTFAESIEEGGLTEWEKLLKGDPID